MQYTSTRFSKTELLCFSYSLFVTLNQHSTKLKVSALEIIIGTFLSAPRAYIFFKSSFKNNKERIKIQNLNLSVRT